ncbi:LamG domain-containing protein, partial [bacterium]|nr:LamG domain-containing protein [bacterium]
MSKTRILFSAFAAMLLVVGGAVQAAPVAYWDFDGTVTPAIGGYASVAVNTPTYVAGVNGQAIDLNGSNQYVQTGATTGGVGITGNFTAAAWVNLDATNGDRTVFGTDTTGTNNGLHLLVRNNKPHMGFYGNDLGGQADIGTGTWRHVVYTYNNGEQSMYVDGVHDNVRDSAGTFTGDHALNIGRWNNGNYADGRIDDAAVWNTALSAWEIRQLGTGAATPATVAPIGVLPPPYTSTDVGGPSRPGSAGYDVPSGTAVVEGSGGDIWGNADQFQFAHAGVTDDFTAIVRLVSQENTDGWAKAGLMARVDTSAGAAYRAMLGSPSNQMNAQWRDSAGG